MISPQTENARILEFQLEFQSLLKEFLKAIYNEVRRPIISQQLSAVVGSLAGPY